MDNPTTPSRPPCGVSWCKNGTDPSGRHNHLRDLGSFDIATGTVSLMLVQVELAGILEPPMVRVWTDDGTLADEGERADIPPLAATLLGLALEAMPLGDIGEFIEALLQVQVLLGERPEPVDFDSQTFMVAPRSALQVEADASTRHDREEYR